MTSATIRRCAFSSGSTLCARKFTAMEKLDISIIDANSLFRGLKPRVSDLSKKIPYFFSFKYWLAIML
jgi:hypothetical protein